MKVTSALAVLALIIGTPAFAQTAGSSPRVTQEVFVTATVAPTALDAVTRSVTVITREDLERLGLRSVIEALRLVPGVDARARGPRDVQTDFSIRGATFGQNLMLADGMRLNDSQSGHHNGEVPLPVVAIDRIEIVAGAGSAAHGTDAVGGTINVITRRGTYALGSASFGEHRYADAQVVISGRAIPAGWTLAGWGSRSDGFMIGREFAAGGVALKGSVTRGLTIDFRHQRRAFGANGFYGNSPSKEWTDQILVGAILQQDVSGWSTTTRGLVRNHGDHFLWNVANPGVAENRHRTNAVEGGVELRRLLGNATLTVGGSGGVDGVKSSNLGNHDYTRGSVFTEVQSPLGSRSSLSAGLRFDSYSSFGQSLSPTVSAVASVSDALRVRASVAHAFRKPTFTELYYTSAADLGNADLVAEQAWTIDAGADWNHEEWGASFSVFRRWDEDVIDWIKTKLDDQWIAMNIRDVRARGFETSLTHRLRDTLVRGYFARLHLDAPVLPVLSKYVLEYARNQAGMSISVPIFGGVRLAVNVDHRRRRDGQSYELVSARVSQSVGRVELALDGTNLLDEQYTEVAGVAMPGSWVTFGVTVR